MNVNFVVTYTYYTVPSDFKIEFDLHKRLFMLFSRIHTALYHPAPQVHQAHFPKYLLSHRIHRPVIAFSGIEKKAMPVIPDAKNKELWKDYVSLCAENLKNAPDDIKNDPDIVKVAVQKNGLALAYASKEIKNNHFIVLLAVTNCGFAYLHASDTVKECRYIALAACRENIDVYDHLPNHLKIDPDIVTIVKQSKK